MSCGFRVVHGGRGWGLLVTGILTGAPSPRTKLWCPALVLDMLIILARKAQPVAPRLMGAGCRCTQGLGILEHGDKSTKRSKATASESPLLCSTDVPPLHDKGPTGGLC